MPLQPVIQFLEEEKPSVTRERSKTPLRRGVSAESLNAVPERPKALSLLGRQRSGKRVVRVA